MAARLSLHDRGAELAGHEAGGGSPNPWPLPRRTAHGRSLGARVAPIAEKEIGFAPLTLTATGRASPLVHLSDIPMLHWHGEGFELPAGAERLAATPACETQGFARGRNILGLQFHPEAGMLPDFERWLIGHSAELAQAGIAPEALRQDARAHGPALRTAGQAMLKQWLRGLDE